MPFSSSECACLCLCRVWWQSDHSPSCEASLPVLWGHFLSEKVTSGFVFSLQLPVSSSQAVTLRLCQVWWQSHPSSSCEASLPVWWGHFLSQEVTSGFVMSLPVPLSSSLFATLCLCQIWWQMDHFPGHEASLPVLGGYFLFQEVTFGFMMPPPVAHNTSHELSIGTIRFRGNHTLSLPLRPWFWLIEAIFSLWRHIRFS